jgi:hypothetical protein
MTYSLQFSSLNQHSLLWRTNSLLDNGLLKTFPGNNHAWRNQSVAPSSYMVSEAMHSCRTVMEPLEAVISIRFSGIYKIPPRVEAGSNTSTVALRVVGGDEKGSLKSETVKYDSKSHGTRTRERLHWQGPAAYTKDRHVFPSQRAPHKNKTVIVKE